MRTTYIPREQAKRSRDVNVTWCSSNTGTGSVILTVVCTELGEHGLGF